MTTLSKTFIAGGSFVVIATSAFSKGPMEFKSGMAYVYAEPGKMSAMAMVPGERNQEAMMKHATKDGQLFSTSGTLDPTGNFYRP